MSEEFVVSEDTKSLIQHIIHKYKLNSKSKVTYDAGAEIGDGYSSKTIAVHIEDDQRPLRLFVKCPLSIKPTTFMDINAIYANEICFYDVIYPTYIKFSEEKGVEDVFRNVPKCHGSSNNNIIALEDLRTRGFALFAREKMMNDSHIAIIFKAYAKFHAFSVAYKDQKGEAYEAMIEKIRPVFDLDAPSNVIEQSQKLIVDECIAKWDPVADEHIISRTKNLGDNLLRQMKFSGTCKGEHSVITKGDCWTNNMMFQYEGENPENPSDAMLIDWQVLQVGSLVLDLSYFFYSVAPKDALSKLKHYLKLYHGEFSNHIRLLGSDPDIIYPYSVLEKEWKRHCAYGYAMTIMILRLVLISKEDAPDMDGVDFENMNIQDTYVLKNVDEYVKRIKILTEHMVENDFLNFDHLNGII